MHNKEEIVTVVNQFLADSKLGNNQVIIGDESAMVMHGLIDSAVRISLAVSPSAFPTGGEAEWVEKVVDPFMERTQYRITIMPMQRRVGDTKLDESGLAVQTKSSLYRRYMMLNERQPFNPHYIELIRAFKVTPTIRVGDVVTAIQVSLDIIERILKQFHADKHTHTEGNYELTWDRINGTVYVNVRGIRGITLSTTTGLFTCNLDTHQLKELNQWLQVFIESSVIN